MYIPKAVHLESYPFKCPQFLLGPGNLAMHTLRRGGSDSVTCNTILATFVSQQFFYA